MLSRWDSIQHLLRIGLLVPTDLLDGHVATSEHLSRNHLLRIEKSGGPCYIVKQPRDADLPDAATMWTEAAIFWLSANDPEFARMRPWMPHYFHYHEPEKILTIEYVAPAHSLMARQMSGMPIEPDLLDQAGRAFGTLHGPVSAASSQRESHRLFRFELPWVLTISSAGQRYVPPSPAAAAILGDALGRPEAQWALARARDEWRSAQIIHGDAKAANVLVLEDGSIRIIDWEIAALGDGLWDVAGMVHSLLTPNPLAPVDPLPAAQAKAAASLAALWQGYLSAAAPIPAGRDPRETVLRLAGARILQTCLECAHHGDGMPAGVPSMLRLATELLTRPETARAGWP